MSEQTEQWECREGHYPHYQGYVINEKGKMIAITYDDEGGHKVRLIAAAPQMLAALEAIGRDLDTRKPISINSVEKMESAIAAAKGETA
jgi:hypothetical protein